MKISARMMKGMVVLIGVSFFLAPLTVLAANKVVVIPLFDVTNPKPLKNIITVAKGNGMFTDPVAAVNSITDASATNPYLVVIGPGVYTVTSQLQMKEYVDIAGSGQNVTKITGAISIGSLSTSAVIVGANHAALSSLTVENTGGGDYSFAVYNYAASPMLTDVIAAASGGMGASGGVYNASSSPVMTQVTVTASGGTSSYGVYNYISSPVMTQVTATASGGTNFNYGVFNSASSNPKIRHSAMEGGTDGLYTSSDSTSTVSQSTIIGGAGGTGTMTCVACDNGSGTALSGSCQ